MLVRDEGVTPHKQTSVSTARAWTIVCWWRSPQQPHLCSCQTWWNSFPWKHTVSPFAWIDDLATHLHQGFLYQLVCTTTTITRYVTGSSSVDTPTCFAKLALYILRSFRERNLRALYILPEGQQLPSGGRRHPRRGVPARLVRRVERPPFCRPGVWCHVGRIDDREHYCVKRCGSRFQLPFVESEQMNN